MVVHKQSAASWPANPAISGQHSSVAPCPIPTCTRPPRRSTHALSLRVSIGHCDDGALGRAGQGSDGDGDGDGDGGGLGQEVQAREGMEE